MGTTVARRDTQRPGRSSFSWQRQPSVPSSRKVCSYWLSGTCTRNPCRFVHSETSTPPVGYTAPSNHSAPKHSRHSQGQVKDVRTRADNKHESKNMVGHCSNSSGPVSNGSTHKTQNKICDYWMNGNCVHGDKCKYLHSWCYGKGLSMITQLEGHKKAVTGITLPSGSDKLFSGSKDGNVRVWNCHTGECVGAFDMGSAVGCVISEGPWVFVGLANVVKACNIQTNAELTLGVPGGLVYALCVATDEMLVAGIHDGSILAWTFNSETSTFEATALLKGHTGPVVSLFFGAGRLYSASMDNTIRVWDLEKMQCINTLSKHSDVVMSVICWDQFLLSCSLDQNLKIWAATKAEGLEVVHIHKEEHGILALCGMPDEEGKPILLCACNDNTVRLYELPSFIERGRIFTRQEVRIISAAPGGLIFTGDGTGRVTVWKLSGDSRALSEKSA